MTGRPARLRDPARPEAPEPGAAPRAIGWPVWRLAWVIVFGAFASSLDASLTNIGLRTIGVDLGAPLSQVQWVASGYLVALAVSLPMAGWLGRRFGVGRLWLVSLFAFTVASGLCAAAPTAAALIGLRLVQGLAGGLLVPAGQTVLGHAVGADRLGRVMATLGIAVTVGPALGPVIGGLVLHALSWRWLFAINLPVGALGLLLGLRVVPRGRPGSPPRLDGVGLVGVSAGLPLTLYALTEWGSRGSPTGAAVLAPLALGVLALAAFGWRARRHPGQLLDLRLYRDRRYAAASAATVFAGMTLFGGNLLLSLYFQLLYHDDAIGTGLRLLPLGAATALALPFVGRLADRYGAGVVCVAGSAALVATCVPFALLGAATDPVPVLVLLALLGAATACVAVPPGIAAYTTVRPDQLPDATTGVNIVQRVGGALGGALFSVILARHLAGGVEAAFHIAFWWMTAGAAAALVASLGLWRALAAQGTTR